MAKVYGENRRICQIVINMKVIMRMTTSMGTVSINGQVETSIKDNMSKMSVMVKEK